MRFAALLAACLLMVTARSYADGVKDECVDADTRAQSLRSDGKLTDALAQLDLCTSATCPAIVRADCTERIDEIHRVMPSVVLDVKTSAGVDVTEAHVDMDGHVLREHLDGRPVSVDPGDHTFVISARGQTQTLHMLVHEGDKDRRLAVTVTDPIVTQPPIVVRSGSGQRVAALIVGGSGVIGLVLGATFGGLAIARHDAVTSVCPMSVCPSDDARTKELGANADAQSFALGSTIALIAGAVLATTGVVLFFTAPRRASVTVGFGTVAGTF